MKLFGYMTSLGFGLDPADPAGSFFSGRIRIWIWIRCTPTHKERCQSRHKARIMKGCQGVEAPVRQRCDVLSRIASIDRQHHWPTRYKATI